MIPVELLHPMMVHFPIVLVVLLLALDATAWLCSIPVSGRGAYAVTSAGLAVLAGVSAAATAMLGDAAAEIAISRGVSQALLESHEDLGVTTAIVLGVWALVRAVIWWCEIGLPGTRTLAVIGVEAVICAMVLTTAYFGGGLVYQYAVNVMAAGG